MWTFLLSSLLLFLCQDMLHLVHLNLSLRVIKSTSFGPCKDSNYLLQIPYIVSRTTTSTYRYRRRSNLFAQPLFELLERILDPFASHHQLKIPSDQGRAPVTTRYISVFQLKKPFCLILLRRCCVMLARNLSYR